MKLLKPRKYNYTNNEMYKSMNFAKGLQYGFVAQELEKIIPQLVTNNVNPAQYDKNGNKISDQINYKGVNYISLIPFTVAAINEQEEIIETQNSTIKAQDAKIEDLQNQITNISRTTLTNNGSSSNSIGSNGNGISDVSSNTTAILYQNVPNPFNQQTSIQYFVPTKAQSANIMVFDLNGKLMNTVPVTNFGKGAVTINGNQLNPGMFVYSLVVDGKIIDTKRMILTQ